MNQTTPQPPTEDLSAPSMLIMGPPGTGKSWSLHTLLAAGLEVFIIATEPNAVDTILDACERNGVSTDKLHWTTIMPVSAGWSTLGEMARQINLLGYEDLGKIKSGIERTKTGRPAQRLIETLANFHCDHCKREFGDCEAWGDDRALVLDSLSGLNDIALRCHIGMKPTAHQGEWGVAMNFESEIIKALTRLPCYTVLIAHIDRDYNVVTQTTTISPGALGAKLGPKIGREFSEVVLAKRVKDQFVWSTSEVNTDVKNRSLAISDSLLPNFQPIVDAHRRRKASLAAPQPSQTGTPSAA